MVDPPDPPKGLLIAPLVLDPAEPLPAARQYIKRHYTNGKLQTLHHHAGAFYKWNGRCYEFADPEAIRGELYAFLDASLQKSRGKLVRFQSNMARVSNVADAIKGITNVPSSIAPPAWLADAAERPLAAEIVACANGLLHLPSCDLSPATPASFR